VIYLLLWPLLAVLVLLLWHRFWKLKPKEPLVNVEMPEERYEARRR